MSDSDPDPRFRIPRGSSDEEIDSDLASIASDPPPHPQLPDRATVTAAATTLRAGSQSSDPLPDLRDEEKGSEADDEADDAALSAVTYAATRRRDLSNAAMRAAREVLPAGEEVENVGLGGEQERMKQKDMMAKMLHVLGSGDTKVSGLADLKKKVARLSASGKKELSVPVANHIAGRIARGVAYEEVKREVTEKWKDVVSENRKKQHLVFPLNAETRVGKTCGIVVERFKPGNEYETEIADMLREAGVGDEDGVVRAEEKELKEVKVRTEEVLQRKREMARIRSLMFHYEQRMRRIKKIKSRKYRRILKKEKEKVAEQERQLLGSDAEEEAIKAERKRVEERMTLRHKNTSKWVRRQLSRGEAKRNTNTRAAIEEQLQLHEQLKRRQEGLSDGSDESDSEGSISDSSTDERLDEELEQLRKVTAEEAAEPKKGPKRGLMSMRFMQAAQERQRKQALELLEEMNQENVNSGSGNDDDIDVKLQGRRSFTGHAPKSRERHLGDKKGVQEAAVDDPHAEVNFSLSEDEGDNHSPEDEFEKGDVKALKQQVIKDYENDEGNRLVETRGGEDLRNGKLGEILMGSSPAANTGFTTSLRGRLEVDTNDVVERGKLEKSEREEKRSRNPKKLVDDEDKKRLKGRKAIDSRKKRESLEIYTEKSVKVEMRRQAQVKEKAPKRRKVNSEYVEVKVMGTNERRMGSGENKGNESQAKQKKIETEDTENCERKGEGEADADVAVRAEWMPSENDGDAGKLNEDDVERMKFLAEAFAGAGGADEEEFERMKEAEIEKELPTAKDIGAEVLPGWGTWDGAGMKKRKKKERSESAFAKAARERLAAARAKAISKRGDRNLAHVILDEKRVKRAAELTLASVPFPFTRAEQWEMELKTPICKELVTGNGFSQKVRPRVEKKLGVVIEAIQKGAVVDKTRRRKLGKDDVMECNEERGRLNGRGRRELEDTGGGRRGRGKKGVIELRKQKASKRNAARKGLMM